jgi:nitrite reductase (NADH) large subunit
MPVGPTQAWRCTACGYIHRGDQPPTECPVCGAAKSQFEPYVEEPAAAPAPAPAPNRWRCLNCGYVHEGTAPPQDCPVCGVTREQFEAAAPAAEIGRSFAAGHVVVLGSGIAGISAAEAIRRSSPDTRVTLVSKEPDPPYYRLNLTRYLAGQIDESALPIHPADWYEANRIELLRGAEAAEISPADKKVLLHNGEVLTFDRLILTAGAHPFVPPLPGVQREGVKTARSWRDAKSIVAMLRPGIKCVCIGGGVLGVETAGALARRGADVTLLEGHGWLMPRQLNQAAGRRLQASVERIGVRLRTQAKTKEIVGDERVGGVLLEDGGTLPADMVIITTGVRPNSFLARRAGLEVGGGVVVDNHLFTSHPDILAAGDVAEHRGVLYGTWTPSQYMGTIAGMNAIGLRTEFGGIPRSNTLKVLDVDLLSIGRFEPEDGSYQVIEQETGEPYLRFVFRDGRLVGAILLGDTSIAASLAKAVAERTDMSGLLAAKPQATDIVTYLAAHWP